MDLMYSLFVICFVVEVSWLVQASEDGYLGKSVESENKVDNADQDAYDSFGSAVYGPNSITKSGGLPLSSKSGYPLPPSAFPSVPAAYSAYLNRLGYGNYGYGYGLNSFGRYGMTPYSAPFYGYGSPYNALSYGYGPGLTAGLGYNSGLVYGNPALGRAAYTGYGSGYPGYGVLGYRYGGLGYNSLPLRAPGVPAPVPGAYAGLPGALPAAYADGTLPISAAYAGIRAPVAAASAPVPVPAPGAVYRPSAVATQGKDGSLRYTFISPAGQRLAGY